MIWVTSMFLDDWDMLQCQMEAFSGFSVLAAVAEAPMTHRGAPKPLHLQENPLRWAKWGQILPPVAARDLPAGEADHWGREHAQRNAAWPEIADRNPDDTDPVLICDADEIPSRELLEFLPKWAANPGATALAIPMRTCLFAVDWEVTAPLPPTCVAATVSFLRRHAEAGVGLGQVRDKRESFRRFPGHGGWHLSWMGGPDKQREKLLKTTCHVELLGSAEGDLIASGERFRTAEDGGGLPVVPVDVDESWPAYVHERRCPENWFRPRKEPVEP